MVLAVESILISTCWCPTRLQGTLSLRLHAAGSSGKEKEVKKQRYGRYGTQQQFLPFHSKHVTQVLFCDIPLWGFKRYQRGRGWAARPYTFIPLTPVLKNFPSHHYTLPSLSLYPSKQANKTTLRCPSVRQCVLLHLTCLASGNRYLLICICTSLIRQTNPHSRRHHKTSTYSNK